MGRSTRQPTSPEQRAKLSERAKAQHARARGFDIPADKIDRYRELRRRGIRDERLWPMLGLPLPNWLKPDA